MTKSTTAPDCDVFVKGKHQRQFAYEAHTACDQNGYVLEAVITPGNVHDSVAFDDVYDKVTQAFPEIETIVADSAYKTPLPGIPASGLPHHQPGRIPGILQ